MMSDKYCPRCDNTGEIINGDKTIRCPCINPEKFMNTLEKAIKRAIKDKDKKAEKDFLTIRYNLPEYPIMAMLEAEHLGYKKVVESIMFAFDIKPFADQCYTKSKKK